MPGLRKIDWYVVRTFVGPFALCVAAFAGLFIIIDFFMNIDEFVFTSFWSAVRGIVRYYALRLPACFAQREMMLTVLAAAICLLRLEQANETVAIRSSGISARRIAVPILLCSAVVMLLGVVNQEVLVPALNERVQQAGREVRQEPRRRVSHSLVVGQGGQLLLTVSYDPAKALPTLKKVRIAWDDTLGVHHEKEAERAFATAVGATWYMEGVRQFDGRRTQWRDPEWEPKAPEGFHSTAVEQLVTKYLGIPDRSNVPLIAHEQEPVPTTYEFGSFTQTGETWPVAEHVEVIHPSDPSRNGRIERLVWVGDRWLMFGAWRYGQMNPETHKVEGEAFPDGQVFESSVRPSDIEGGEFRRVSGTMTLGELRDLATRFPSERFRHRCWVVIWNRVMLPFANVLLVLLTLPLVFRQTTHSALVGVAFALLVVMAYMVGNAISLDLGNDGWFVWRWPAWAGAFPTVVFGAVGVWVFSKMDEV